MLNYDHKQQTTVILIWLKLCELSGLPLWQLVLALELRVNIVSRSAGCPCETGPGTSLTLLTVRTIKLWCPGTFTGLPYFTSMDVACIFLMRRPASYLQHVLRLLPWRCSPTKGQETSGICKSNVKCMNVKKPGAPFLFKWDVAIVVEISAASAGEQWES